MDIKTVPIRLNSGETDFIKDLKYYLISNASKLEGKDVFLLRNLSKKGVGFFVESSSFYPDFILWVVEGKRQRILFLDPKGIRETRNFNDSKVIFCREQTPELAIKINDDLMRDGLDLKVSICAYILSVTQYKEVSLIWGEKGATKQEFEANRILFMKEGDSRYLELLFDEDA